MENWNSVFDKVLREFGISAKWLSHESGVSEYMISQFRKGHKDATTGTLRKLLAPLPQEARERFHSLVLGMELLTTQPASLQEQLVLGKKLRREDRKKLIIELVESLAGEPAKMAS